MLMLNERCTLFSLMDENGARVAIYNHNGAVAVLWSGNEDSAVKPGQFRHGVKIGPSEFELTADEADEAIAKLVAMRDRAAAQGAGGQGGA